MSKTIMIIERDIESMHFYQGFLSKNNYKVGWIATDIQLLKYEFNKPDLFIINSQFITMNAIEICQHLKRNPALEDVPVIIISGMRELKTSDMHCKAAAFVEKPFVTADLLLTIKQILARGK